MMNTTQVVTPLTTPARLLILARLAAVMVMLLLFMGCASVGSEFPDDQVSEILVGKTTQKEIRQTFGAPWRVGLENGQNTWTYGRYRYRLIGKASTKDLVIRFGANGVVSSYVFNTTDHEE